MQLLSTVHGSLDKRLSLSNVTSTVLGASGSSSFTMAQHTVSLPWVSDSWYWDWNFETSTLRLKLAKKPHIIRSLGPKALKYESLEPWG